MNITCLSSLVYTNDLFYCNLSVIPYRLSGLVQVDFQDGDIRYYLMRDNFILINKTYSSMDNYTIRAVIMNNTDFSDTSKMKGNLID